MRLHSYSTKSGSALDCLASKSVTLDKGVMAASGVFATTAKDRVGDVLEVGGIHTEYHELTPIVLWDHGKHFTLPIGKTVDPDGSYTVRILEDVGEAVATTYFSQHLLESEQIFRLIEEGIIRAQSIGYRPLKAARMPVDRGSLQKPGLYLQEVELLEVSWVGVPANQEAVRAALAREQICGKALSPMIRRALAPFAGRPRILVRGGSMAVDKTPAKAAPASPATGRKDLMDPPEVTAGVDDPTPGEVGEDTPSDEPLGAEVLRNIHSRVHDACDYCESVAAKLENPEVQTLVDEFCDAWSTALGDLEEQFAKLYPDLDPPASALADEEAEETEEAAEGDKDEEPDEEEDEADAKVAKPRQKAATVVAKTPPTQVKRLTKSANNTISECADFLDEHSDEDNLNRQQKVACKYYSKCLKEMANPEETKDDGAMDEDEMTPDQKRLANQLLAKAKRMVERRERFVRRQKAQQTRK